MNNQATSTKIETSNGAHVVTMMPSSIARAASPTKVGPAKADAGCEDATADVDGAEVIDQQLMWRAKFVAFYESNAPVKIHMVTDKMMVTWEGRYEPFTETWKRSTVPLACPSLNRHPVHPNPCGLHRYSPSSRKEGVGPCLTTRKATGSPSSERRSCSSSPQTSLEQKQKKQEQLQ